MKNFCFIIFLVICTNLSLISQTIELRFTGEDRNHSYVRLDSVQIINYTQDWTETIYYPDTVLILNTGTATGITTLDEVSTSFSGMIPNPSYGISDMNIQVVKEEYVQLSIFDVQGKKITELQQLLPAGKHTLRVYLSMPQLYLLKLTMTDIQHTFKIINISNGGQDKIEYYSANSEYPMVYEAEQGKGNSQNPFNMGDNMGYYGYATVNGEEFMSVPIEQIQNQSENFTLLFDTIMITLPSVTTNAISNITSMGATGGGTVTFDGNTTVTARGVCWSTSPNPTLSDSYTTDGTGLGAFTSSINGLTANTTYYVRAYATNSVGTVYGNEESFTTLPPTCSDGVTDIDGNHYDGVQIGTQCWMKQNLRVTKYANGTSITLDGSTSSSTPYRYYPNGNASNVSTYGYLYNWPAAMNGATTSSSNPSGIQGVCPAGWHLPSDAEWTQLTNYVSSQSSYLCNANVSYIAKAMASTSCWNSDDGTCTVGNTPSANNATGFGAVPAGAYYGSYEGFGDYAILWSATEGGGTNARLLSLYYNDVGVGRGSGPKSNGFSVRCLRD